MYKTSEENSTPAQQAGPLSGIRVVELGVWHAGPGGTAILGDLGAEVIKIESLDGDSARHHGSFGPLALGTAKRANWTLLFEMSNRNKRSICLNVASAEGKSVLHRLVEQADVFLTNLRTSTKPKLGVDYDSIRQINPKIVHISVSGFGPDGPYANVGGFDPMGQAISGMMFLGGTEEPAMMQVIVLDQLTAITASHAAITGLLARERTGIGQEAHVSLYGSALWLMHANFVQSSVRGVELDTSWDRTQNPFARTTFKCADGTWIMGTNHPEEKYWARFCEAVGAPELAADPRFDTKEKRAAVNPQLISIFDSIFEKKTREEWLAVLHAHGVLFAPVHRIQDVLKDEQAVVNGYVKDFDHPYLGKIRIPGFPVRFGAHFAGPVSAAPDLGEPTAEVLAELGYDVAEFAELRESGTVS